MPARAAVCEHSDGVIVNRSPLATSIEARRRRLGYTQLQLVVASGIGARTLERLLAGHVQPQRGTLYKIERGFERLAADRARDVPAGVIAATFRAAIVVIAAEIGDDAALIAATTVRRERSAPAEDVAAGRLRRLAMYLVCVELEIENVRLGDAIGCSRQNVKQARDQVEDLRENELVDALLERCAAKVTGRAM